MLIILFLFVVFVCGFDFSNTSFFLFVQHVRLLVLVVLLMFVNCTSTFLPGIASNFILYNN